MPAACACSPHPPTVLLAEDDPGIGDLVTILLTEEGYTVVLAEAVDPQGIASTVASCQPACVLLDSTGHVDYGDSWAIAAQLAAQQPPVAVVMFTAHQAAVDEARAGRSPRSQAASFAGVVAKPFDPDELLAVVAQAVQDGTSRTLPLPEWHQ